MANWKNAATEFKGFNDAANVQLYEVSPQPAALLNSGNWNALLRDATTDYADSLDLKHRQNTPIDIRYGAPTTRNMNNFANEFWTFDWNGKVRLARKVQFAGGKANLFDLDDFAKTATKFCLHGLDLLLRVRPLPSELEFFVSVSNLQGKMLQNDAMLEKAPPAGAVCRTSGKVPRAFTIPLATPAQAVDLLQEQLLIILGATVGAFEPLALRFPLTVSARRFASAYSSALSRLTLRAIRAITEPSGCAEVA